MTMLVTGADGFVGSFITRQYETLPLVDSQGNVDLRDKERVLNAVKQNKIDSVIHLAAQSFIPVSFKDPQTTYDVNFTGTFNLLTALKEAGFTGRMIYISSGDIYGLVAIDSLPIKESYPLKPRSPYAVSKVATEALCYQWSQTENLQVVTARPFNHIGPGQHPNFVVSDFARQIIEIKLGKREPVLNVGDIDVTRDFTDVRDIVRAYTILLDQGKSGEAYNICSGEERTIRSLLDIMLNLSNISAEIREDAARMRPSEQRRVRGDCTKLKADTSWRPEISLEQTLLDILNHWENELL
jgi:GDP-4-dehydro-6-deoxy-D-mannose reductase